MGVNIKKQSCKYGFESRPDYKKINLENKEISFNIVPHF